MRKSELKNCPKWLRDAKTENENVEIDQYGRVVWHGGVWCGGVWCGGEWWGGEWRDGLWRGGVWRGGVWCDVRINRLIFMAATIGIVFDKSGYAIAYRSTGPEGRGRYNKDFIQKSGRHFYKCDPSEDGTCCAGIHVSDQATAFTYFGIDPDAELWRVKFHRKDLLACDGKKARIRGGHFKKIEWPFFGKGGA